MSTWIDCVRMEWIKQRGSLAGWAVFALAMFTPAIILGVRLLHPDALPALHASAGFWSALWRSGWESAAIFFLPMGAVLLTALATQVEHRNNGWKHVHTLPVPLAALHAAKFAMVVAMALRLLAWFVAGLLATAWIPALLVPGVALPTAQIPLRTFAADVAGYAFAVLPILGVQYVLGVRFANFIVPVGAGFLLWVGTLALLASPWAVLSPYAAPMLHYLAQDPRAAVPSPVVGPHWMVLAWSTACLVLAWIVVATRRRRA